MEYTILRNEDLSDLITIWNSCITAYPQTQQSFLCTLLCDENFSEQGCILAKDEEKLIGFCIAVKRLYPYLEKGLQKGTGWILAIAVLPGYRRKGIGSKLLSKAEDYLHASKIILSAYSPYYFFPGIPDNAFEGLKFFEHHVYRRGESAYAMVMDLNDYLPPLWVHKQKQAAEEKGYRFQNFCWKDGKKLLAFIGDNFSVGWRLHAVEALRSNQAERRIILCWKEAQIVGYVQCGVQQDESRFGPFGIAEAERNSGLGSILLHEMWMRMKENMISRVWFHSTDSAGRRFYERHGMQVTQTLYYYEKRTLV